MTLFGQRETDIEYFNQIFDESEKNRTVKIIPRSKCYIFRIKKQPKKMSL